MKNQPFVDMCRYNELLAFVFFADGTYVHMEVDEEEPFDNQPETSGMEWGTYARNSTTGELTVTQRFDGNGDTGLTDAANGLTTLFAQVSGDTLTLQFDDNLNGIIDDGESLEFYRDGRTGVTVTGSVTEITTDYTQGELRTAMVGDVTAEMQCDMGSNYQIGDTVTYDEIWTRSGGTVTGYEVSFPEDQWTAPIDLSIPVTVTYDDTFTEVIPMGNVTYTSAAVETGSVVWNAVTQTFEGSLRTVTTLSWNVDGQTSVCDQTVSISASIIAGSVSEFLGSNYY